MHVLGTARLGPAMLSARWMPSVDARFVSKAALLHQMHSYEFQRIEVRFVIRGRQGVVTKSDPGTLSISEFETGTGDGL